MLRIIITFFNGKCYILGYLSTGDDSPHSLILNYLNIDFKPTKYTHLIIGNILYYSVFSTNAVINNFWF